MNEFKDTYELETLVRPFYDQKDTMHDWSHIKRCAFSSGQVIEKNKAKCDLAVLTGGLILHGVIYENGMEVKVLEYLNIKGCPQEIAKKIVLVAWDSQKDSRPETLEGGILHDAHLLEGDDNFIITKALVTGTARGQKLQQTVDYFFKNIADLDPAFYFETSKSDYAFRLKKAVDFFSGLKNHV